LLKTAILNVFDNACKYSENNIVNVELLKRSGSVSLSVIDKGIGIPVMDLSSIGTPFKRASNSFSVQGSGIGLSLTKKIMTLHKGEIIIESTEDEGTKVTFRIPEAV